MQTGDDIEVKSSELGKSRVPSPLSCAKCLPSEVISASTLCFEAKKKTSLPLDTIQVNVSTPSSSESSDSGFHEILEIEK